LPATKVFLGKDGEPVYAPCAEHLAPDVGAIKLWLLNRQPQRWRDRHEVAMSLTIEEQLATLSPAERLEQLKDSQARAAGLLIEVEAIEVEVNSKD